MNFTNIMVRRKKKKKKSRCQSYILYDFTYIELEKPDKTNVFLNVNAKGQQKTDCHKIRIIVTFGERKRYKGVSVLLIKFYFLIRVIAT